MLWYPLPLRSYHVLPVPLYEEVLPASSHNTRPSRTTAPLTMRPLPAMEPTVSLKPFRLKVAPASTVRAVLSGRRSAAASDRMPPLTVVAPV